MAGPAARGLGVAVLSESMAAHYRDRLTARIVDGVRTRALLAHCRRAFDGPGPV
ncbi:hypothetical protein [Streptomyces carminius]|uniref:hypothetical protein n=1 Tax=Streptomyces carminius TaxID=2665496 RepID=UPI0038CD6C6F